MNYHPQSDTPQATSGSGEHFDVLIVGAGISGIGAAYHLGKHCPGKSYAILEGRENLGGTWDLFKYPGIRSDSDMSTLGYGFKPWTDEKVIADAPRILDYLRETIRENGIDQNIRYQHRVLRASWSSEESQWTLHVVRGANAEPAVLTCRFLQMCTGYYNYKQGYAPDFAGQSDFEGEWVHPQFWPEDLELQGKKMVVIGSGATAMTIVPAVSKDVESVTMLQRSPTYVVARPNRDRIAKALFTLLPNGIAHRINRWKNAVMSVILYRACQNKPEKMAKRLIDEVRKELPDDFDVETHFTPTYGPWDQRLCLLPDGDLFEAINAGKAHVVTDHIERITANGIQLKSGEHLEADVIVSATGLQMQLLSGIEFTVDGDVRDLKKLISYKGVMFGDMPNMANTMGYTNASWTLKADLISGYVCRVLKHMDKTGATKVMAEVTDPNMPTQPFMDLTSGYVARTAELLPKQGTEPPWRLHQNYLLDYRILRFGRLEDGVLQFTKPQTAVAAKPEAELAGVA
ncbi:MAG: NAD(P)/FAD-dependent oxidoreductase [Acidobacteriota bacterium]